MISLAFALAVKSISAQIYTEFPEPFQLEQMVIGEINPLLMLNENSNNTSMRIELLYVSNDSLSDTSKLFELQYDSVGKIVHVIKFGRHKEQFKTTYNYNPQSQLVSIVNDSKIATVNYICDTMTQVVIKSTQLGQATDTLLYVYAKDTSKNLLISKIYQNQFVYEQIGIGECMQTVCYSIGKYDTARSYIYDCYLDENSKIHYASGGNFISEEISTVGLKMKTMYFSTNWNYSGKVVFYYDDKGNIKEINKYLLKTIEQGDEKYPKYYKFNTIFVKYYKQ